MTTSSRAAVPVAEDNPAWPAEELEAYSIARRKVFYPKTDLASGEEALLEGLAEKRRHAAHEPRLVAEICVAHFGVRPAAVAPLRGQGTFHYLYSVTLPGRERYIFRANTLADAPRSFEFLVDRWIYEVLSGTGVPVACVERIDLSRREHPFDYEIMCEMPGRALAELEDTSTQFVPPRLLAELGQMAARTHRVETAGFGLLDLNAIVGEPAGIGRGVLDSWAAYIRLNLDAHIEKCMQIGAISGGEALTIGRLFEQAESIFVAVEPRLLHGDLSNRNTLTDGERITALLDWEDCLSGDAVFDIAYWGTFCRDYMLEPFLEGYRRLQPLADDFPIRYWLYYLRVALSKTVHRHRFGYADRPGRPPASLRIQKGIANLQALGWGSLP